MADVGIMRCPGSLNMEFRSPVSSDSIVRLSLTAPSSLFGARPHQST